MNTGIKVKLGEEMIIINNSELLIRWIAPTDANMVFKQYVLTDILILLDDKCKAKVRRIFKDSLIRTHVEHIVNINNIDIKSVIGYKIYISYTNVQAIIDWITKHFKSCVKCIYETDDSDYAPSSDDEDKIDDIIMKDCNIETLSLTTSDIQIIDNKKRKADFELENISNKKSCIILPYYNFGLPSKTQNAQIDIKSYALSAIDHSIVMTAHPEFKAFYLNLPSIALNSNEERVIKFPISGHEISLPVYLITKYNVKCIHVNFLRLNAHSSVNINDVTKAFIQKFPKGL